MRPPEVKKKRQRRVVKVVPHKVEMETFDKDTEVSNSGTVDNMLPHQSAAIVKVSLADNSGSTFLFLMLIFSSWQLKIDSNCHESNREFQRIDRRRCRISIGVCCFCL